MSGWTNIDGGATAARGYRAAGVHAGIKKSAPDLALLVSDRTGWRQAGVTALGDSPARGFMARRGRTLYVCLDGAIRRFMTFADGKWAALPAPAGLTHARPIALTRAGEQIVLACTNHPRQGQLALTPLVGSDWRQTVTVTRAGAPAHWPATGPPAVGRLGDRVAVAWKEDRTVRFDTCAADGRFPADKAIDIFATSRAVESVSKAFNWLFIAVPLAMIALTFWPG